MKSGRNCNNKKAGQFILPCLMLFVIKLTVCLQDIH